MRISDWSSDVCSSDLSHRLQKMQSRMLFSQLQHSLCSAISHLPFRHPLPKLLRAALGRPFFSTFLVERADSARLNQSCVGVRVSNRRTSAIKLPGGAVG